MCGECCKNFSNAKGVILFPADIIAISKELIISVDIFIGEYTYSKYIKIDNMSVEIFYIKHIDGACIFLSKDLLCGIHEYKPIQCREGPLNFFWDGSFDQDCIKSIVIPENYSTDELDDKLIQTLIHTPEE
jgi:Fe-S-cluster containining protein